MGKCDIPVFTPGDWSKSLEDLLVRDFASKRGANLRGPTVRHLHLLDQGAR